MPRGSAPGERRGGRQLGSRNKFSISRAQAAIAANTRGIDPQDKLEMIAVTFLEAAEVEARSLTAASQRRRFDLLDKAARVLEKLMPYRYPRLSAIRVAGDHENPLSLSVLSDRELGVMRRMMLKVEAAEK
jgi:hypothetical protein